MSYWDTLAAATEQLESRSFAEAERLFTAALAERQRSPGRVFLTEKVSDNLRKVWGGLSGRTTLRDTAGRWSVAVVAYRQRFRNLGDEVVGDAARLSEFLPEDGAIANQVVLVSALYLLTRSELYHEELVTAVPVMKAAFRTALRTGQPFPVELIRHDLPLTEEDRLWLARKGDNLLEALFGDKAAATAVSQKEWARVLLQLLQPVYFGTTSRLEQTRHWFEALLTDRHLGDPVKAISLYRSFVDRFPQDVASVALARVRLVELLANIGGQFFAVPRYREVEAELAADSPPAEVESASRYAAAMRIVAWRRPTAETAQSWASAAVAPDGRLAFVYWCGAEPRDVAFWKPGEETAFLEEFLAPCSGRLVWAETQVGLAPAACDDLFSGRPVRPFVEALLEAQLPSDGLTAEAMQRLAMSQATAWRASWDWRRGHPYLPPPHPAGHSRSGIPEEVVAATVAGLLWQALLARVRRADPCLRHGIVEQARRGDAAASFLREFLFHDLAAPESEAWQPWTVPPLRLRPDPLTAVPRAAVGIEAGPRPDLTGNSVAVVTTGNPAGVLATWGAGADRWRVVLDRPGRLDDLAAAAGSGGGLITLLPSAGGVHCLPDAVTLLEELLHRDPDELSEDEALLPLFHWSRLVETHNGDLLDFQAVRARERDCVPVCDRYADLVATLQREVPGTQASSPERGGWADQYHERAQDSRLVAGPATSLLVLPAVLDAMWGVHNGGDAAWVFLDSPAVHWQLWLTEGDSLAELHHQLAARGRRHLSLVLGGQFMRRDLEELLTVWLAPYGSPYTLALTDTRPPFLHLAVMGVDPNASVLVFAGMLSQLAHLRELDARGERPVVLMPESCRLSQLWEDMAAGRLGAELGRSFTTITAREFWSGGAWQRDGEEHRLVVPVLTSLGWNGLDPPAAGDMDDWSAADQARAADLAMQKQLCALEVNALQASGAVSVDVADPRWWRRFPRQAGTESIVMQDGGEQAVVWATEGSGRAYDLPSVSPPLLQRKRRRASNDTADTVAQAVGEWLRDHGLIHADGWGDPPGVIRPSSWRGVTVDRSRIRLHLGGEESAWYATILAVAEKRELGDQTAWILVIGEDVPVGAAALVAAHPVPGRSVWPEPAGRSGNAVTSDAGIWQGTPLVWIRPAQIHAAATQDLLADAVPTAVYAGDIRRWLPDAQEPKRIAAATLRWLARGRIPRVDLFASSLPTAWADFLHRLWAGEVSSGGSGEYDEAQQAVATLTSESGTPVAIGRLAPLPHSCLACGSSYSYTSDHDSCPTCGLDGSLWLGEMGRDELAFDLLRVKLRAMQDRSDMGRDGSLHVWLRPEDHSRLPLVLHDLGLAAREVAEGLLVELPTGNTWHFTPASTSPGVARDADHAILFSPAGGASDLVPFLKHSGPVSLWIHPCELSSDYLPSPRERAYSCRYLLTQLAQRGSGAWTGSTAEEGVDHPGREVVPAKLLQGLSGLPVPELMASLNALRWAAVLQGELTPELHDPASIPEGAASVLLARLPFAEIDYRAQRMADALDILLPLLLSTTQPGLPTMCDLAALPARVAAEDLRWLDRFLLASSQRLSYHGTPSVERAGTSSPEEEIEELLYESVAGTLFSSRRRIGYLGSVQGVTARLRHHLELFLASVKMLLSNATPGDEGLRIELTVGRTRFIAADVLELGCALGLWRWLNAGSADVLPLAELMVLGKSALLREGSGEALLNDMAVAALQWEEQLKFSLPLGLLEPIVPPASSQPDQPCPLPTAARGEIEIRIADLVLENRRSTLVLRGPAGSDRLAILVAGLGRALSRGQSLHAMSLVCPDSATAARVHAIWRREVGPWQPPIFLVGDPGLSGTGSEPLVDPSGVATILIEAQRISTEHRLRLCQRGRQGPLLATVELGELAEPWDHLFLTTPNQEDVIDLTDQCRQAKKIWREVRQLLPQDLKTGRTRRREKGECRTRWVANLDECLATLENEAEQGRLTPRVSVVASMVDDLTYLGRRLATRGWLPVFRRELEYLQLPGPLEFLAAVTDTALAVAASTASEAGSREEKPSLLASLLPPGSREAYDRWRRCQTGADNSTLRELYDRTCRTAWAAEFLTQPQARMRVEKLIRDVGDETPARFFARPLWEAWYREVALLVGQEPPPTRGTVVDLATPDSATGRPAETLIYLCLGSEPASNHYRVLSRVTDSLLVLYQEKSPLPSEIDLQ